MTFSFLTIVDSSKKIIPIIFNKLQYNPIISSWYGTIHGFQGDVTWVDTDNDNQYEVDAIISLSGLGLQAGGEFEFWWSMECGNELAMLAGEVPESSATVPEPGTLLLLGDGLLGLLGMLRKRAA